MLSEYTLTRRADVAVFYRHLGFDSHSSLYPSDSAECRWVVLRSSGKLRSPSKEDKTMSSQGIPDLF